MEPERERFLESVDGLAREVYAFHTRWRQVARMPGSKVEAVLAEIVPLIDEEVQEFRNEATRHDIELRNLCAEAADVLFVALGNILRLGATGTSAMDAVRNKNAAKTSVTHHFDAHLRKVSRLG